ncbi:hypothetical protein DAPPUDRAFT_241471 [Daphnia pulex]|uniref:Uncharacterized protein n=1 Tax=Daphnia pulex TaxID=6669 RepID=E9GEC0_DAPPU|nr:hypothetical protein DAPPUDRAFT_241471 [Daphnia pulex]|eukprot:EFX82234.1 hypothetical protein DAPPUDRAFT_241471 [Daphnia pulex]
MNKLAMAIQKRREVKKQMAHVIEAIRVAAEEAKQFQEKIDLSLAEMVTVLKKKFDQQFHQLIQLPKMSKKTLLCSSSPI